MKRVSLICTLVWCFLAIGCQEEKKDGVKKIDKQVLESAMQEQIQLLDVRTQKEYGDGHIDGAVNFDVKDSSTFLRQIKTLDKDQPVYVYCKMGGRSAKATQILKAQGFTTIYDYAGGYTDWINKK